MANEERRTDENLSAIGANAETVEAIRKRIILYARAIISIDAERSRIFNEAKKAEEETGKRKVTNPLTTTLFHLSENLTILLYGMSEVFEAFTREGHTDAIPRSVDFLKSQIVKRHLSEAEKAEELDSSENNQ